MFLVLMVVLVISVQVAWWLVRPDTALTRVAAAFLGVVIFAVVGFSLLLAVAVEANEAG